MVLAEVGGGGDGTPRGRLAVIGDSDFATDAYLDVLGNRDVALNAVAWTGGEETLAGERPKDIPEVQRPLSPLVLTEAQARRLLAAVAGVLPGDRAAHRHRGRDAPAPHGRDACAARSSCCSSCWVRRPSCWWSRRRGGGRAPSRSAGRACCAYLRPRCARSRCAARRGSWSPSARRTAGVSTAVRRRPGRREALDALVETLVGPAGDRRVPARRPGGARTRSAGRDASRCAPIGGRATLRLGAPNAAGSALYAEREGHPRVFLVGTGLLSAIDRVFYQRGLTASDPGTVARPTLRD